MTKNQLKQLIREIIEETMMNEGVSSQEVKERAADTKERHGNRINMVRNDIADLIINPDSEFKEYYPGWSEENFREYYKEIFGEEYTD